MKLLKVSVVRSINEIDDLMSVYFAYIKGQDFESALKCFSKKRGFGGEILFVFFQSDLDDYDMAQLSEPLDDQHVLLELGYPAVEIEKRAYLSFETFYAYLEKRMDQLISERAENTEVLKSLLLKVKNGLNEKITED